MSGQSRCTACGGYPRESKLTLARPASGDLAFCGFHCYQRWAAEQAGPVPAPTAKSRHPLPAARYPGPSVGNPNLTPATAGRCRSCQEPIRWGATERGKRAPFNVSDGENHFVTCPQRREWRKAESAPAQVDMFGADETPPAAVTGRRPWDA